MNDHPTAPCPGCGEIDRRRLLLTAGGAVAAVAVGTAVPAVAKDAAPSADETLVSRLFGMLTDTQKQAVCFGWEHPKRQQISNNWMIVPQTIGKFYTPEQREVIRAIFNSNHSSEEWVQLRLKQMKDDSPGGFDDYSIALFGTPGSGKFEWVLTGRHTTMRLDGDSEPGIAFGGPIFYGHAAKGFDEKPDHPGNVYWYQALRANEVYKALSGKQRERAVVPNVEPLDAPETLFNKAAAERPGLPVAEMTRDQRELVGKVLEDLLAPMRKSDVDEARRYIEANGGVSSLNMAYYSKPDIGSDQVWDVWRLEGPAMVWYFRGAPHVHTWVRIGAKPAV